MRARDYRLRAGVLLTGALLAPAISDAADTARFALSGSGMVAREPVVRGENAMQLRAQLAPAASASEPMLVANERFALTAMLTAASVACAADTIFRDAFDGTGL